MHNLRTIEPMRAYELLRRAVEERDAIARAVRVVLAPAASFARAAAEASSIAAVLGSLPTPPGFADAVREAAERMAREE